MRPTHASLIREIVQYLQLRDWYLIQMPAGGIIGQPGISDLLAFKRLAPGIPCAITGSELCRHKGPWPTYSYALFIEIKIGKDDLSDDQWRFREAVVAQGFEYILARSLDDVIAAGV